MSRYKINKDSYIGTIRSAAISAQQCTMYLPYVREISFSVTATQLKCMERNPYSRKVSPVVDLREWHTMIESPW